ncbi:MAG: Asp-tRNA(Asn)/Glu-tRNA(Gln) amidotransferase A subunit family amidase [Candidatus Azotimanducaceae bacterium]
MRIGWDAVYAAEHVEPCVVAAMLNTVNLLGALGVEIVELIVPDFTT